MLSTNRTANKMLGAILTCTVIYLCKGRPLSRVVGPIFASLALLPIAFVERDEEQQRKQETSERTREGMDSNQRS